MAEVCPACAAHVDDTGVAAGGMLRCSKCSTRFPKPRIARASPLAPPVGAGTPMRGTPRDEVDGLGIHPALAKKYREKNSMPPQESEHARDASREGAHVEHHDTRPLPDDEVLSGGSNDGEPGTTNPGRPVQRRNSLEGDPQREAVRAPPVAPKPPQPQAPVAPPAAAQPAAVKRGEPVEPFPVIPGYVVTELVGKGAMGRVYRASSSTLAGTKVAAVKILAPELASRADFIQRFEREGAAMRAVKHPGVVAVLDAGSARQPDGSTAHFISMEFIEGPPLRKHLDKGPLTPERALHYARLIIQGLGAAHARGVIHRDLKPENILAPPGDERLVLVDFGLAGILDEANDPHPNLTKSRMTMGTVNYMAPEQRTDAKRVDQRADLYAAGVIFYELLTGDLPLGRFALPTERGVPVPQSVDRCIVRALARNPDERYQHAEQFDADLRAIEDELKKHAARDTVIGRARPGGTSSQRATVNELPPPAGLMLASDGPSFASSIPAIDAGTAWMSAAPWMKRPILLWSAGALVVGALLGVVMKLLAGG
jgi:serine/threonine protein kinase